MTPGVRGKRWVAHGANLAESYSRTWSRVARRLACPVPPHSHSPPHKRLAAVATAGMSGTGLGRCGYEGQLASLA